MEQTLEEMDEGGAGDKGVWVTEVGWGSDENVDSQLTKPPEKQASLLTKTYEMMLEERDAWNLQGVLWYTWRDAPSPENLCSWCASAGLVDDDLDTKPAWDAYTAITGGDPGSGSLAAAVAVCQDPPGAIASEGERAAGMPVREAILSCPAGWKVRNACRESLGVVLDGDGVRNAWSRSPAASGPPVGGAVGRAQTK